MNIASIYGLVGGPKRAHYCASKGGVIQLTHQEAIDWAPYHIRVNAVAPGLTLTPLMRNILKDPKYKAYVLDNTPLRCLATVDDVASAACFLASDTTKMITDVILPVDGGGTAR